MVPNEVSVDTRLCDRDVRVFNILAGARRGNLVTLGYRRIAEMIHCSPRLVLPSLAHLQEFGHIRHREKARKGQRPVWELTSKWFSPERIAATRPAPEPAVLNECARCHKQKRVRKTGFCHGCASYVETEGNVRRARVALGAEASCDEIACYLKMNQASKSLIGLVRKIDRDLRDSVA